MSASNMLDVPNFFWDSEPTLHPLYFGVREYLEIKPRIQVLNERCRVFLDLAEILSDSIADSKMSSKRITLQLTPIPYDNGIFISLQGNRLGNFVFARVIVILSKSRYRVLSISVSKHRCSIRFVHQISLPRSRRRLNMSR